MNALIDFFGKRDGSTNQQLNMDNFILIANPISGKGQAKKIAEQAYTELKSAGHQGDIELTTGTGDAKQFAHEAAARGIQWVIACGGDGTLHEVVNGIANAPDITLGILPCGRGNDFAAAVGVPRKPQDAIRTLFNSNATPVDLGRVTSAKNEPHYFTTIATCGYDAEVSRRGAERKTPFSGTASYVYAAIATLFEYQCPFARIAGDFGNPYEGHLLLTATGITSRYGGGFRIVPEARYDDGLFDICIIRPVPSFTILRLLITLFWGGHVSHPAVEIHRGRIVSIETDPPILLYADGEPMCETPATIEIIHHGLTVLTP